MNKGFYRNCLEDEILCASPIELVRMLYSGTLESVENVRRCLREGDIAGRGRYVNKCFEILLELAGTSASAQAEEQSHPAPPSGSELLDAYKPTAYMY